MNKQQKSGEAREHSPDLKHVPARLLRAGAIFPQRRGPHKRSFVSSVTEKVKIHWLWLNVVVSDRYIERITKVLP
jgi:hypothetical protein